MKWKEWSPLANTLGLPSLLKKRFNVELEAKRVELLFGQNETEEAEQQNVSLDAHERKEWQQQWAQRKQERNNVRWWRLEQKKVNDNAKGTDEAEKTVQTKVLLWEHVQVEGLRGWFEVLEREQKKEKKEETDFSFRYLRLPDCAMKLVDSAVQGHKRERAEFPLVHFESFEARNFDTTRVLASALHHTQCQGHVNGHPFHIKHIKQSLSPLNPPRISYNKDRAEENLTHVHADGLPILVLAKYLRPPLSWITAANMHLDLKLQFSSLLYPGCTVVDCSLALRDIRAEAPLHLRQPNEQQITLVDTLESLERIAQLPATAFQQRAIEAMAIPLVRFMNANAASGLSLRFRVNVGNADLFHKEEQFLQELAMAIAVDLVQQGASYISEFTLNQARDTILQQLQKFTG
ncbi:hypothetical protein QOT17_012073 [Balamuthia mandrillaris]